MSLINPPIEGFSGLTGSVLTLDRGITMVMRGHWASFGSAWDGTAGPHALCCFDNQASPCASPTLSLFYDQNGRLAVYQDHPQGTGAVYSYHPNGKIRQIIGGATPTKYYYGPDDEKIAEIDNGVVRYFPSPIYEREGSSHVMYAFFNGSRVAKRVGTGAWQYYLTDHLGSIRAVLDANGTVTKRINYLPFGAIKSMSVGTLPGYLFNGNRKNAYGVYDYGARGYLPYLGVFTQPDNIVPNQYAPQALNRFSYVLNNPVNRIDPTGHESFGGQGGDPTSAFYRWVNSGGRATSYGIIGNYGGWTSLWGETNEFLTQDDRTHNDQNAAKTAEETADELRQAGQNVEVSNLGGGTYAVSTESGIVVFVTPSGIEIMNANGMTGEQALIVGGVATVVLVGIAAPALLLPAGAGLEARAPAVLEYLSVRVETLGARPLVGGLSQNDLNHIFGDRTHLLQPLVERLGSWEAAGHALETALMNAARSGAITTEFYGVTVRVAGFDVAISGRVVDGVVRIGTAFIRP